MKERLHMLLLAAVVLLAVGQYRQGQQLEHLASELALDEVAAEVAAPAAERASGSATAARLVRLEKEVRRLRGAGPARDQGVRPRVRPGSGGTDGIEVPEGSIDGSALVEILDSEDPEVRDALSEVIRSEMETHRAERREERNARWEARTHKFVDSFVDEQGLDAQQRDTLLTTLFDERDQIRLWFQEARKDYSFGEAREKARSLRGETTERLAEGMSDEQAEAFRAVREEEDNRRFGAR